MKRLITLSTLTFIMFLAFVGTVFCQQADTPWPCYMHDTANTGQSEYSGPEVPAVKWRYLGLTNSYPVFGPDGLIYAAVHSSSDNILESGDFYHAIDKNGSRVEFLRIRSKPGGTPAMAENGNLYHNNSSGSYGYIQSTWIYKYNSKNIWTFPTAYDHNSSPAIGDDGTIYVGTYDWVYEDAFFYAIEPDGREKWRIRLDYGYCSSPAIGPDGTIYICSGNLDEGYLYAINPAGEVKWQYDCGRRYGTEPSPSIADDGTIYLGTRNNRKTLVALNPDGSVKWEFKTDGSVRTTAAIAFDGTLYFGTADKENYGGYLHALNPDGTEKWRYLLSPQLAIPPTIGADGTIYISYTDAYLHALNPDGTEKWKFQFDSFPSSPIIDEDGTMYVGTRNYLYALGERQTEQNLTFKLKFDPDSTWFDWGYSFDIYLDVKTDGLKDPVDIYILMEDVSGNFYSYPDFLKGIKPAAERVVLPVNMPNKSFFLFEYKVPETAHDYYTFSVLAFKSGTYELISNIAFRYFDVLGPI